MAGITIVENIFAGNSGEARVKPGDVVVVNVDTRRDDRHELSCDGTAQHPEGA
jgi:hypothetical protein